MGIFILLGFSMVALAIYFWAKEWTYFWDEVRWEAGHLYNIQNIVVFPLNALRHLLPFAIDVFVTLFLAANLGFGGGVLGGVTGLFASNCISIVILKKTGQPLFNKKKRGQQCLRI